MSISAISSYSNPYRLVADGQAGRATTRSASSTASNTGSDPAAANFSTSVKNAASSSSQTSVQPKAKDNSPEAIAARVAAYQQDIAAKAKTDPALAFVEKLKDKYSNVKATYNNDAVALDGSITTAAEINAKSRNRFVDYSVGRINGILSGLQYIKDGGANKTGAMNGAADELKKLVAFAKQHNASSEVASLTKEYTAFKTGAAISLQELADSFGITI